MVYYTPDRSMVVDIAKHSNASDVMRKYISEMNSKIYNLAVDYAIEHKVPLSAVGYEITQSGDEIVVLFSHKGGDE